MATPDLTANSLFRCGVCEAELGDSWTDAGSRVECPKCGVPQEVAVFPALFNPLEAGDPGRDLLVDTHSSCYYHPKKEAVRPCEGCGRFLCGLCDIDMRGSHLCPKCIEDNVAKGEYQSQRKAYVRYDDIALSLAVVPILLWPFTLITAPTAIFMAIASFFYTTSVVPRGRWRSVLAIFISLVQLFLWVVYFFILFGGLV